MSGTLLYLDHFNNLLRPLLKTISQLKTSVMYFLVTILETGIHYLFQDKKNIGQDIAQNNDVLERSKPIPY